MNRKLVTALIFAPLAILFLSAQISAPPVYSPKLGVGGAPPTSNGDLRVYGNFQIDGTCTGCPTSPPGGSNTQVQYNNAGAFGGDAGLTYDSATDALTVAGSLTLAGTSANNTALFTSGTLGVARGGTGIASYTAGNFLNALDATTLQQRTPAQVRTAIVADPGGSDTQVQFNSSGNFGGDAGLTYNSGTDALTAGSFVGSGSSLTSLPEESGSFTVTFADGCTADQTYTFEYKKTGNIVALRWGNGSANVCVGDSISYDTNSLAPVPAAIRPITNTVRTPALVVTDNSTSQMGYMNISTSGNIQMSRCIAQGAAATGNFACGVSLWTTANNRGFEAGGVVYNINQ